VTRDDDADSGRLPSHALSRFDVVRPVTSYPFSFAFAASAHRRNFALRSLQ
jgi:hypothetical protein